MKWKGVYFYYVLIAITLLSLLVSQDTVEVPLWGALFAFIFFAWVAMDQSWKAFKRQGRAAILVSLKPAEGGHSTIHPDDITLAMARRNPKDKEKGPSFVVFATGGFVHGGIEWQGQENFIVCPPEHVESTGPALVCHTKLRRVTFEELPDYVQSELSNLKFFSILLTRTKKNLWFGMTSKLDGTTTSSNLALESKFLDQTYIINTLKSLLKDKSTHEESNKRKKGEQIVINVPEGR